MTQHPWLKGFLDHSETEQIEQKVAEVERITSGEIVPMIVYRSSTVGHVPLIVYLSGMLAFYLVGANDWLLEHHLQPWWFVLVWAIALFPITHFLAKLPWLQRVLVSPVDRAAQTQARAMNEFFNAGLEKTDGSTGILLMVSIVDHQAVVLGDTAISQKISHDQWEEVVQLLLKGIKSKHMADGFCDAIGKCGEILATHFPILEGDTNELPNHVIIKR